MEETRSFITLTDFHQTPQHYIPEDRTLCNYGAQRNGMKQKQDIQYVNIGWLLEQTNTFNNLGYNILYEGELDLNVRTVNFLILLGIIHQTFKSSLVSRHTRTFAGLLLPYGSES
jgi:hypothetical protein